ncbi:unnamed protein product, partial [Schistosoma margrebowiei]
FGSQPHSGKVENEALDNCKNGITEDNTFGICNTRPEEFLDNSRNSKGSIQLSSGILTNITWLSTTEDLLEEGDTTMNSNSKGIIEVLTSTCQRVLGHNMHHHKGCIFTETVIRIREKKQKIPNNNGCTRERKVEAKTEYTEANKQLKKSVGSDEQKYV